MSEGLISIYTDGSCSPNPGPGACAALIVIEDNVVVARRRASKDTTNNIMELEAIDCGLYELAIYLYDNYLPAPNTIEIVSDSKYALGVISGKLNAVKNEKLVKVIKRKIELLTKAGSKVTFRHVKGHAGDKYNERAHLLAKGGTSNTQKFACLACKDKGYIWQKATYPIYANPCKQCNAWSITNDTTRAI